MLRSALGIVSILVTLLALAAVPRAEELDWDDVIQPGRPLHSGMLARDEIIVHFAPGAIPRVERSKDGALITDQPELDVLDARYGAVALERVFPPLAPDREALQPPERAHLYRLQFDGIHHTLKDVAAAYRALPSITRVEPNQICFATAVVPDDPLMAQQIWLRSPVLDNGDIRALAAWYHQKGDPDVVIAIVDTGVDYQHPDLGGTAENDYRDGVIWNNEPEINGVANVDDDGNGFIDDTRGWDVINLPSTSGTLQSPPQDVQVPDNDPMDYDGHGTMVAGCAAALTDNGIGVAGASWGCTIMPVRIGWTTSDGLGVSYTLFMAQAIDYARVSGARILNLSFENSNSGGLDTATDLAVAAGMIIVESAGNDNVPTPSYLGGRSDCLSVAAVTPSDSKASFSNYGNWVDLSAPGTGIFTTAFNRQGGGTGRHTYAAANGTSFSSPIVAGAAGLLLSATPGLTGAEARDAIRAATDDIDASNPGFENKLGTGRINMARFFPLPNRWTVPEILPTYVDAVNTAAPGDEVAFPASYVINTRLLLPKKLLSIYGGYDATFTTRDPVNSPTLIDATGKNGPAVFAGQADIAGIVIDGFEIVGGKASLQSGEPVDGEYGGGILVKSSATPIFRNIRLHDNIAGDPNDHGGGGAIAVLNAAPVFEDVEITQNSGSQGSAIYIHRGSPVFRRVDIHDNISYPTGFGLDPLGGAIAIYNAGDPPEPGAQASPVTFEDCTIRGHDVEGPGGAIYCENSHLALTRVTITGNTAAGDGGGVFLTGGSYTGTDNEMSDNTVAAGSFKSGGGLYAEGVAPVLIDGGVFARNGADFAGGGIYLGNLGSPSITNTFVVENHTGLVGSGLYLNAVNDAMLANTTVANNTGASQGGNGLFLAGGTATLANNVFAFNGGGGTTLGDGVACSTAAPAFQCNLAYSNDAGNYTGCEDPTGADGNVSADPVFCDFGGGDYRIDRESPAAEQNSGGCGLIGAGACFTVPVAVSMSAVQEDADVVLHWRTAGATGSSGYRVVRARDLGAPHPVSPPIARRDDHTYTYRDVAPEPGRYRYQIAELASDGSIATLYDPIEIEVARTPVRAAFLEQNVPNPFNPTTTLHFGLARSGRAVLEVYDVRGRRVRTLLDEDDLQAGRYRVTWDGRDTAGRRVGSGVYLARLRLQDRIFSRRMLLIK